MLPDDGDSRFVALGGLVVVVLAIGPKVRRFKPIEDNGV
jgi:hypothetical protein